MKKILGLVTVFLAVILVGCGGDKVEEEVLSAFEKIKGYDNYEMEMVINYTTKTETGGNITIESLLKRYDDSKYMMTMSMTMGVYSVEDMKVYYEITDDATYVYTDSFISNSYIKSEVDDQEELTAENMEILDSLNEFISTSKNIGVKTIDGKEYTKVEITLGDEYYGEMFADSPNGLFTSTEDTVFGEIKIYAYIDLSKQVLKRLEFDMIDYIKVYNDSQEENTQIEKFEYYIDIQKIGEVEDFDYPEVTTLEDILDSIDDDVIREGDPE